MDMHYIVSSKILMCIQLLLAAFILTYRTGRECLINMVSTSYSQHTPDKKKENGLDSPTVCNSKDDPNGSKLLETLL